MSIDLGALADSLTAPEGLSDLLVLVVTKQAERDVVAMRLKVMDKALSELESLAAEKLAGSGLDGCRVAGRTWRVEESLRLSVLVGNRDAILAAAHDEKLADAITLNTATLKAWLVERAKDTGCALEDAVNGTRFEGLVSQFVDVRLRSRTTG